MAGMKRRGEQGEIKAMRTRRKTSQCSPSVMLADKETNYISASWHRRVKLSGGSHHSAPAGTASVLGYTDTSAAFLHESRRRPFILASFCILPTLASVVFVFRSEAELTVIIPNSIIFINATGLRTMHFHESQGPQPISLDKSSG